ncbi:MAG TPA: 30S ribosomal protein S8 [archaeon]|nr:30S ribosomal protein S8 [archaeon]
MSMTDPVMNGLTIIRNSELASKTECEVRPASKFFGEILKIAKNNGYIGDYKLIEDHQKLSYKVSLNGKLNTIKAIKPRYAVKRDEFEKYEKRYLPARDVGLIIVSTSKGLVTHTEAKAQKLGGRLIAFMY